MIDYTDSREAGGPSSPNGSDRDELLTVLGRPLRRSAIRHLGDDEGPVGLSDLADRIAAAEGRDPRRVAAALHHSHLPKLADLGLVEYDHRRNLVTPTAPTRTPPYLDRFED